MNNLFIQVLQAQTGLKAVAEYRFHEKRKWRFDFCIPEKKLAIEQEGGIYTNGRHTRGKGFEKDIEKYNEATALGFAILRFTPDQMLKTATMETIKRTAAIR